MRDFLGNKIVEGSMMMWVVPENLRCVRVHAIKVEDGGIKLPGGNSMESPPTLVIAIQVPINANRGREPSAQEFACVLDPNATEAVERILKH